MGQILRCTSSSADRVAIEWDILSVPRTAANIALIANSGCMSVRSHTYNALAYLAAKTTRRYCNCAHDREH